MENSIAVMVIISFSLRVLTVPLGLGLSFICWMRRSMSLVSSEMLASS